MDSHLGLQYVTPIVLDVNIPQQRPGALLLKRINTWLASGRLIMALDAAGEDDQIHQYGKRLVDEALVALGAIIDGSILLPGAEPVNPDNPTQTGPKYSFADDESLVEAHDTAFGNPAKESLRGPSLIYYGPRSPYTW